MIRSDGISVVVLTPALVGVTGVDPLGPDIDVVTDADGLPYIPRWRMAARLRDAAITVSQAFPDDAYAALTLFGSGGAVAGRRALIVGHARLPQSVRAAVAHAPADSGGGTPMAGRVNRACTVEWQTTSVDELGAPEAGRLRSHRGLAPGLVLRAPLRWHIPPAWEQRSEELVRTLARCCLALDQIGRAEHRDVGRVHCLLGGSWEQTVELADLPKVAAA